ncbi:hypothetical protein [Clostridium sp. BJN0001]|uniref:hypothetical protein n=1 Tax=Clostridium sp. BJN0001 TaxID=2930219 RepID=UPI001FD0DC8D|nr:hypothetical protein [Clostridium sp. BJN0001]
MSCAKSKKIFLYKFIFVFSFFVFLSLIFYFTRYKFSTIKTINPVLSADLSNYDLNGDGKKEKLEQINGNNKIDFSLKSIENTLLLSSLTDDKKLFDINQSLKPKVFLYDLSRNGVKDIILQGSKNGNNILYCFNYNMKNKSFNNFYSSSKNIFGILDSNNTKSPTCYSLESKIGNSSIDSFMLVNNKYLDTTSSNNQVPSLNNILKFIDIIQLKYDIDTLPDIFSVSIPKKELSMLWNLDKKKYSYYFQNAFFYDYKWDEKSNPISIKCFLSFSKSEHQNSSISKECIITITLKKSDSDFKISSISIKGRDKAA